MAAGETSTKRLAIDKAQARMVAVVGVASFLTVFCLMASKAVLSTNLYQAKLTTKKQAAHAQLQKDINAYNSLSTHYDDFVNNTTNIINGSKDGTGANDGDNSKIILDALPYQYNFPAVTSSIEDIVSGLGLQISSISGTDDQLNQQTNTSSPTPTAVQMPFTFSVNHASYDGISQMITRLQQSIRPIAIDKISMNGSKDDMSITVTAHTYYQPAKSVDISQKVLK